MSFIFNPHHGVIVVGARLHGPSNSIVLRLALDTGASTTMVGIAPLVTAGYDPAFMGDRVRVTTPAGVEFLPRLTIERSVRWAAIARIWQYLGTPCRQELASTVCWV